MNKKLQLTAYVMAALLTLTTVLRAQQSPAPQSPQTGFQLETFYMAIMRRAPSYDQAKVEKLSGTQREYWQSVAAKGDLILGGPIIAVKDTLAAVMIFHAGNPDEAAAVAKGDPMVKSGLWTVEVHPWATQKGVLKPIKQYEPATDYYLGFLMRGPSWSPDDTPERQRIQDAHMANMKRLAEMGKLVAGGPFTEDQPLRGIFVFRTATYKEALELAETDPAVQAGRLRIELWSWRLPAEAFAAK